MGKHARRLRIQAHAAKANADAAKALAFVADVTLEARQADDATDKPRRFSMLAYTGGPMVLAGWRLPVVVDLEGVAIRSQRRPILLDHAADVDSLMGQTDQIAVVGGQLMVAGEILGEGPRVQAAVKLADRGFAWQASIGASVERIEHVPAGKTAKANGTVHQGPLIIARRASLREISFVALGADDNTAASIAAGLNKELDMDFAQWLEAQGFAADHLTDAQKKNLQAMFDREQAAEDKSDGGGRKSEVEASRDQQTSDDVVAELRAHGAKEIKRQAAVRKLCAGTHADIEAQAIEEGWDETKVELEVLRASRPRGPAIHSGGGDAGENFPAVLEAALCRTAGVSLKTLEEDYDEQTLEAADARDLRGAGLHTLMYETIRAGGRHVRPGRMTADVIRTAFECDRELRASGLGFSTYSVANLLSNVANKVLLQSFTAVLQVAQEICGVRNVSDFKTVTSYRLTGTGAFQQVGPMGELKHISLDEDAFTNAAGTWGAILSLARKDIINDDLGAFLQIPQLLGRQSAIAREKAVFTLLLSNPGSFFASGNKNLLTGGTSVLSIGGLTLGEQLFLDQTDKNGDPILVAPAILLVPTGLKTTANQLMTETRVNETTTAGSPKPANNPHSGKWMDKTSPYLNGQGLSGQSATAWYLIANPSDVAMMQLCYLNGRDTPIIESGEPNFDTLGIAFRGYFDFGVAMQDFRGAIKSNGA